MPPDVVRSAPSHFIFLADADLAVLQYGSRTCLALPDALDAQPSSAKALKGIFGVQKRPVFIC
jgi:hypothetical protein